MKYLDERLTMVERQLRRRGITDNRVLRAMATIPRHRFVPSELREVAYDDRPLAIGSGQTISQPYMVAIMSQMLTLTPECRVLEIGTGSGYQTAVLASIAREVVTVERHRPLVDWAEEVLEELGFTNITVIHGDGTLGYPEAAPYDAILVTAGGPQVPPSLGDQLAAAGRLVCPVGDRDSQRIVRIVRDNGTLRQDAGIPCMFVPLIGAEGWQDDEP